MWYFHKDRFSDQWNRIQNPETDLLYEQLIFDKGENYIYKMKQGNTLK